MARRLTPIVNSLPQANRRVANSDQSTQPLPSTVGQPSKPGLYWGGGVSCRVANHPEEQLSPGVVVDYGEQEAVVGDHAEGVAGADVPAQTNFCHCRGGGRRPSGDPVRSFSDASQSAHG
jgi:hypothetical protein